MKQLVGRIAIARVVAGRIAIARVFAGHNPSVKPRVKYRPTVRVKWESEKEGVEEVERRQRQGR